MAKNSVIPQWLGRNILDPAHVQDLELRSAVGEFQDKLPRHEAEERAYSDYQKEHREKAAAHHLDGMKGAQAVGDKETAMRHSLLYQMHLKALGHPEIGPVPPEIQRHVDAEDKKSPVKFKAHAGDLFALQDHKDESPEKEPEPVEKSESNGRVCAW